jgi:hypothetical protein
MTAILRVLFDMDLWIGDTSNTDGLGVEFKFLASNKEVKTASCPKIELRERPVMLGLG